MNQSLDVPMDLGNTLLLVEEMTNEIPIETCNHKIDHTDQQ